MDVLVKMRNWVVLSYHVNFALDFASQAKSVIIQAPLVYLYLIMNQR